MVILTDRKTKPNTHPEYRALIDRILNLQPSHHRRIFELIELHREAATAQEAEEVSEVLAEILFGDKKDYMADKLENDDFCDGRETLKKHRDYVGKQIKKCRQNLKMSQEKLAKTAGIPQSHVCRLETGKHAPSYLTIEKIAAALGVKKSQLDPSFED